MPKPTGLELRLGLLVSWKHPEHGLLAPGFEYSSVNTYQKWRDPLYIARKMFCTNFLVEFSHFGLEF
jgi:hypothetical protein